MKRGPLLLLGGTLLVAGLATAWSLKSPPHNSPAHALSVPAETARCPVCGMFVARHATWLAEIRFADGWRVCFDGVKDLFKYYFDVQRFDPGRSTNDIRSLEVTDYYSVRRMDGYRSWYVIGSDVLGPMGHELIPLATEQAAREFTRDHHGARVLTFGEVTPDLVSHLDDNPVLPPRDSAPAGTRR